MKNKLLLIFVILIMLVSISLSSAALTDGLVSYYSFDVDATDDEGINDLTLSTPVWGGANGHISGGFNYTTDYMYDTTFDTALTTFSIAGWVKHDNSATMYIFTISDPGANSNYCSIYYTTSLVIECREGAAGAYSGSSVEPSANTFHYIVLTSDGSNTVTYVDNVAVDNTTDPETFGTKGTGFYLGGSRVGGSLLTGSIDEVGVWNRALTVAEINSLYNGGTGLNPLTSSNTAPVITLNGPVNNSHENSNIIFNANVSDADNDSINCSFFINGTNINFTSDDFFIENGTNNTHNADDGDYGTAFIDDGFAPSDIVYTNFTTYSNSKALLKSKLGDSVINNNTIPSGCLADEYTKLQIISTAYGISPNSIINCYNYDNSSWETITTNSNNGNVYEVAMYWNYTAINDSNNLSISNIGIFNNNTYDYYFSCTDGTDTTTSPLQTVFIDDGQPLINIYNIDDGVTRFYSLDNITWNITVNDPEGYLYAFQINVTGNNDGLMYHQYNITTINTSYYTYNLSTNITDWSTSQNYTVSIYSEDDHTAKKWNKYNQQINKQFKKIRFNNLITTDLSKDVNIELVATDAKFKDMKTNKLIDRVTFDYELTGNKGSDYVYAHTFLVSSNQKIIYRENSQYKAHFIFPETHNWLDFELETEHPVEYLVKKVKEGYQVTIFTKETNLKFKSFGGLNTNTQSKTFGTYYNTITVVANDYFNGSIINNFNITAPLVKNTSNGLLTFNISQGSFNVTAFASGLIPLINISNVGYNENLTFNFSLYGSNASFMANDNLTNTTINYVQMNISEVGGTYNIYLNTTTGLINTPLRNNTNYSVMVFSDGYTDLNNTFLIDSSMFYLNFTLISTNVSYLYFKDEETLLDINNITLALIGENFSQNYSTNTGLLVVTGLSLGEYQAIYTGVGYNRRDYYFDITNTSFFNTTLYLLNSTVATNVTMVLTDELENPLINYYLKIQRYYLDINGFRTVEIVKTDNFGEEVINAELNNPYYKIIITDANTTYLNTDRFQFKKDSMNLVVNLAENYFETYQNLKGIIYDISFDNATSEFNFVFDDNTNTISKAKLNIYRMQAKGYTLVNSSEVASVSGSLTLGIDNSTNSEYMAKAYVFYVNDEILLDQETGSNDKEGVEIFGVFGLLLVVIIILVMAFMTDWDPRILVAGIGISLSLSRILKLHSFSMGIIIGIDILIIILIYLFSRK